MPSDIVVTNAAELQAALVNANNGRTIALHPGHYDVARTLVVPEGATLKGAGKMALGPDTLPRGIAPGSRTTLRALATLRGDILRLDNGAKIAGLVIEDRGEREGGNLVVVASTGVGARVAATIEDCELINPKPSAADISGPTGRALLVFTQTILGEHPPIPHEDAKIAVTLRRSIVRAAGNGSGVFAINFAARGRVVVRLQHNVIGGGLDATGGVSRPLPVTGAETVILSDRNLYRSDGVTPAAIGWQLHGGANPPIPDLQPAFTADNTLIMKSAGDGIEGFDTGIYAAGGWRQFDAAGAGLGPGPVNACHAHLTLDGTRIVSKVADLVMLGAHILFDEDAAAPLFTPGDNNRLYLSMRQAKGTGARANRYENVMATDGRALTPTIGGVGNRVEVFGNPDEFVVANSAIQPAPSPEDFI